MAIAPQRAGIGIRRHFTTAEVHPYDEVVWERRDARITNYRDGSVAFEQLGVEVPSTWSVNATNILAQKYFRGTPGTPEREWSLRQVADRVVDTVTAWGIEGRLLRRRRGGRGLPGRAQAPDRPPEGGLQLARVVQHRRGRRAPAGLGLLHPVRRRHDGLDPQLVHRGGHHLQGRLRRRRQPVPDPVVRTSSSRAAAPPRARSASCAVPTPRPAPSSRAARPAGRAKMVILDVDHPDIEDFIWCKAIEERKARVLRDAGFDMDLDGKDSISLQYQNANNSVRVTDEFMEAVDRRPRLGPRRPRATARTVRTVPARDLFRQIAQAAWECADPGHAVRHHHQQLAHGVQHRAHQRFQPVLASTCTSTTRRATWPAST